MARKKSVENEDEPSAPADRQDLDAREAEQEAPVTDSLPPEADGRDPSMVEIEAVLRENDLMGGTMRIERRGPMDTSFSYIGKIKISNFDIEQIKKMYGGGDYQCQCFRANGQIAKKIAFSIDARFKGAIELDREGYVRGGGKPDVDMVGLLKVMQEGQRQDSGQAGLIAQMMKQQQESSNLMMTMMMENSKAQVAMFAAMFQGLGSMKPASTGLELKDVVSLIPLLKGDSGKQTSMTEIVEAMKGLKEITSGGAPAEEAEPQSLMDKIIGALPHVASTVQALKGGQPPAALPAPPAPAPAVSSAPASPTARLEQGLMTLVEAARKKRDVELYHDLVLEMIGDDQLPTLKSLLTEKDWFPSLFGKLPDATSIQPWMTELRDMLIETLNEDPDDGPDDADPAGKSDPAPVRPEAGTGGAG